MKPTFIALLAFHLCLAGCGKKEPVQPSASNTEATKPEPPKAKATAGVKLWEFETLHSVLSSPAIGSDGTVYVGSEDKKLYAIKTDSKGLAKSPWPMRGQNARHTGLLATNKVAAAEKIGTALWEFKTGGYVESSPAIGSDGTVYVGSWDNKPYAINGKSGVKLWEFETGDWVNSSPAIGSDGTVYVGSGDNKLYAINVKSGVKLWEFEAGDGEIGRAHV